MKQLIVVLRFICVLCRRTISVLPDSIVPYRPLSTDLVQEHFDAKAADQPEPPATEKQKDCLKRAWERFGQRLAALAAALGQIVQIRHLAAKPLWLQLRRWGNLSQILLRLSRSFKISLLGDYRCLRPWAAPEGPAPEPFCSGDA